jgi:hypothetical protein
MSSELDIDDAVADHPQAKRELERLRRYEAEMDSALARSGYDISPCRDCGAPVVCLPDGLSAMCETCVQEHPQAKDGEGAE